MSGSFNHRYQSRFSTFCLLSLLLSEREREGESERKKRKKRGNIIYDVIFIQSVKIYIENHHEWKFLPLSFLLSFSLFLPLFLSLPFLTQSISCLFSFKYLFSRFSHLKNSVSWMILHLDWIFEGKKGLREKKESKEERIERKSNQSECIFYEFKF